MIPEGTDPAVGLRTRRLDVGRFVLMLVVSFLWYGVGGFLDAPVSPNFCDPTPRLCWLLRSSNLNLKAVAELFEKKAADALAAMREELTQGGSADHDSPCRCFAIMEGIT